MKADGHQAWGQAIIGGFVLGGVALALGAVFLFGKFHFFTPTLRAAIVFQDSISGLTVGAPVTFRGVRVGAVASIAVQFDAKTEIAYIPVTVELESTRIILTSENQFDLGQLVARGLRAELNTQSFVTGQSEIDLDFDRSVAAVTHAGITALPEIPTRQSPMQRVKEQLSQLPLRELTENAAATLQSLRTLSEQLNRSLPPLIDSLRTTSDRSAEVIGNAGRSVTELQGRLDGTLADIGRLATAGNLLLTQRGGELQSVLISTNRMVVQMRDVLTDLKSLTSERGTDRTNLDSALRDLATTASSLRGLAGDIERNPQLLLTGRRP